MDISLDFTDTETMEKWIDKIVNDKDDIRNIGTAYVLEALMRYREYFEGNILDESQELKYLWLKINDTIVLFTQRLIDITVGKIIFIPG
jgi:hypothetical protein